MSATTFTRRILRRACLGPFLILVAALLLTESAAAFSHPSLQIGVRCGDTYQNNWQPPAYVTPTCGNFVTQIKATDTVSFYFNTHGVKQAMIAGGTYETCQSCGGIDSVDFFFFGGHGGYNPGFATYDGWDQNYIITTNLMRVGDNGRGAQVLATYSCHTLYSQDGYLVNRWRPVMAGGLKIVVGAHGFVYDGNDQKGTDFAVRMQGGTAIGEAWLDAVWYADNANHPSVMSTGVGSTDCWNRQAANLGTVQYFPRLRDSAFNYVCWTDWD